MTKLFITGSSHASTLYGGMQLLESTDPARYRSEGRGSWHVGEDEVQIFTLGGARFELDEFSTLEDGRVRLVGNAAAAMRDAIGTDAFDSSSVWGFVNIVNTRRFFVKRVWRTHAPSALGRVGNRVPVSEAIVRAMMLAEQAPVRSFYARLVRAQVPVVAIETPRIRHDVTLLRERDERRIARWIDNLNRVLWREYLDELGVPYIEAPAETVSRVGFLDPALRRVETTQSGIADKHHATPEWGYLYLPRILEVMRGLTQAGS